MELTESASGVDDMLRVDGGQKYGDLFYEKKISNGYSAFSAR
jgi:hypothetical protein